MDASAQTEIEGLLRQGLDLYGTDDVDGAMACWKQVLELDPANAEARDYLSSAGRDDETGGEAVSDEDGLDAVATALGCLHSGDGDGALAALAAAAEQSLEIEAARDLVRGQLVTRYSQEIAPTDMLRPVTAMRPSADAPLPPRAGFVLSLVDGRTPVADLVSLSGMDRFDALHALRGLIAAGVVELSR